MFQFTTTNVINTEDYKSAVKVKNGIILKNIGKFVKDNVQAIYKATAEDAELAKVAINFANDIPDVKKGDMLRLNLYIGVTQGSADPRYANDLSFKGRPFSVEFTWKDDDNTSATKTLAKLVKDMQKLQLLVYEDKFLNITSKDSVLIIEAMNEYQRFNRVDVETFSKATFGEPYYGEYIAVKTLDDIKAKQDAIKDHNAEVDGTVDAFFVGKEGFGTYSYLLHNLRIPTCTNLDVFGTNYAEMPIVGAKYNQYTIHYCVQRGPLGMNAVGDIVKSVTEHVFYVKSELAAAFETYIENLGTVTEVKVKNPSGKEASSIDTDD